MLKIWGRPTSIHTQRVLWTCVEAGLPFELIPASATMGPDGHISGGGRAYGIVDTPEYRAMNPNGTIPTMDDDGYIIWESNSICRYLAQTYAPQALYGDNVKCLGLASQWMDWTNTQLEPGLHILVMELVRLSTDKRNPANVEKTRCEIIPTLERLDRHLSECSYVAGDDFTIGDIATGCAVHRWTLFDLETPNLPYLRAWQAHLAEREGFGQHVGPREKHLH
jgi:glutathione S-transferase